MEFKHPKYYAELRKIHDAWIKQQASSDKPETTSYKLPGPRPISKQNKGLIHKRQATSPEASSSKPQAPSSKPQAPSRKRQAP
jgi:hypothetical protein